MITKDYKFVCSHEPWLSGSSDVSTREEFKDRKATYNMDDGDPDVDWNDRGNRTDWFAFDFTLEELKTLKRRQVDDFRDPGYDFQETFITVEELVTIVKSYGEQQGRTIGIYPELKQAYAITKVLQSRNDSKRYEDYVIEELDRLGYSTQDDPCYLQAFEPYSLDYVKNITKDKRMMLIAQNLTEDQWDMVENLGLYGMGIDKDGLITPGYPDELGRGRYEYPGHTDFIEKVHELGLKSHVWTFRNEWMKLYWDHGQDPYSLLEEYYSFGIDGYFADFPLTVRRFFHYKNILCSPEKIRNKEVEAKFT